MRKLPLILCVLILFSCGSNGGEKKASKETTTDSNDAAANNLSPEEEKGMQLIAKSDCLTCHQLNQASTGPAYYKVAAKYPDNDQVVDSLAEKIIKGGAGNWGTVPMIPHPTISQDDAKLMVRYVLSLK